MTAKKKRALETRFAEIESSSAGKGRLAGVFSTILVILASGATAQTWPTLFGDVAPRGEPDRQVTFHDAQYCLSLSIGYYTPTSVEMEMADLIPYEIFDDQAPPWRAVIGDGTGGRPDGTLTFHDAQSILARSLNIIAYLPPGRGEIDATITYRMPDGRVFRIEAEEGATPEDMSQALDGLAPGSNDEWLNISPDGSWLALSTNRFDPECSDWPCLAVVPADLSSSEAVRADGVPIHTEGVGAIASGGDLIVYPSGGGPEHTVDLWAITRDGGGWSSPALLTEDSTYDYNSQPALSTDGGKVLFDCGDFPYAAEGTAICEVGTNGDGFRLVLGPDEGPGGSTQNILHSPDYGPDGSIVFEADWDGEQIWRLPLGATEPVRVTPEFNNDNSPCVLPDGRIASLWYERPGGPGVHEIKVMDPDGGDHVMVLIGSDVEDSGIGCGAIESP